MATKTKVRPRPSRRNAQPERPWWRRMTTFTVAEVQAPKGRGNRLPRGSFQGGGLPTEPCDSCGCPGHGEELS